MKELSISISAHNTPITPNTSPITTAAPTNFWLHISVLFFFLSFPFLPSLLSFPSFPLAELHWPAPEVSAHRQRSTANQRQPCSLPVRLHSQQQLAPIMMFSSFSIFLFPSLDPNLLLTDFVFFLIFMFPVIFLVLPLPD